MGSKSVAVAPQTALIKALRLHLETSLLPGDAPADTPALSEAAQFLVAAALHRPDRATRLYHMASEGADSLRLKIY
ncbi:MAG: hypothetical protein ACK554_00160, partial [Erythrobacteraceae bacterium]